MLRTLILLKIRPHLCHSNHHHNSGLVKSITSKIECSGSRHSTRSTYLIVHPFFNQHE